MIPICLHLLLPALSQPGGVLRERWFTDYVPGLAVELEQLGIACWRCAVAGSEFDLSLWEAPLTADTVAAAVDHAPYPDSVKRSARAHSAHWSVRLNASHAPWLDRCTLLLGIAGVLALGSAAIAVVHPRACASLPAAALIPDGGERLQILHAYPLGLLITGFQKYEIEGEPGVWMASVAAHALDLPEFAMWAPDHTHAQATLELYDQLHRHLLQSAAVFRPGDRISAGQQELRVAALPPDLPFARADRRWLQLVPT